MKPEERHRIAELISEELRTYYSDKPIKAQRIVMEMNKKLDGPGLNHNAIVGIVERILEKEVP